jgi:glycosyltransferase involved in cell wall biosynthesis
MREVLRERPDAARSLKVHVAGPMDARHRDDMMAQLVADGLSEFVVIHGVLPRSQALQLLNRSHVALVLAQRQGMMVPAKIYESVGMGVPTLVITEEESAAFREAQRIGAMTVDGNDVAGMRKILHDMLDGRIPARMDPITPISYEDLAVRMDRLLRDVMAGRPNS